MNKVFFAGLDRLQGQVSQTNMYTGIPAAWTLCHLGLGHLGPVRAICATNWLSIHAAWALCHSDLCQLGMVGTIHGTSDRLFLLLGLHDILI